MFVIGGRGWKGRELSQELRLGQMMIKYVILKIRDPLYNNNHELEGGEICNMWANSDKTSEGRFQGKKSGGESVN